MTRGEPNDHEIFSQNDTRLRSGTWNLRFGVPSRQSPFRRSPDHRITRFPDLFRQPCWPI